MTEFYKVTDFDHSRKSYSLNTYALLKRMRFVVNDVIRGLTLLCDFQSFKIQWEKIFPFMLALLKEDVKEKIFYRHPQQTGKVRGGRYSRMVKTKRNQNDIAHEYLFNTDEVVDSIVAFSKTYDELIDIF